MPAETQVVAVKGLKAPANCRSFGRETLLLTVLSREETIGKHKNIGGTWQGEQCNTEPSPALPDGGNPSLPTVYSMVMVLSNATLPGFFSPPAVCLT